MLATQGAPSNYKNLCVEPADHGIGRSRGGLTTKIHTAVEGGGRLMSALITVGQAGDSPLFVPVLEQICVPRIGPGAPRRRPDAVMGDKAYSSAANRKHLRDRKITAVIPVKDDQALHRHHKGQAGGRPPNFDAEAYKDRNVVERAFNKAKQWRAIATRYDKLAIVYRANYLLAAAVEWLKLLGDTP
jgi:transposase